jgi:fructose-specific phosphotransferase system component IIB
VHAAVGNCVAAIAKDAILGTTARNTALAQVVETNGVAGTSERTGLFPIPAASACIDAVDDVGVLSEAAGDDVVDTNPHLLHALHDEERDTVRLA